MGLERGLTQREVAEKMGVQRPAVSKMERKADMSISCMFTRTRSPARCTAPSSTVPTPSSPAWFEDGREYSAGHLA